MVVCGFSSWDFTEQLAFEPISFLPIQCDCFLLIKWTRIYVHINTNMIKITYLHAIVIKTILRHHCHYSTIILPQIYLYVYRYLVFLSWLTILSRTFVVIEFFELISNLLKSHTHTSNMSLWWKPCFYVYDSGLNTAST